MEAHRQHNELKEEFEGLFSNFSDVVYRLCLYKTGSVVKAEELTQETFLRVWKSMASGKTLERPKSYIYQIARNLIVDYYKENKPISLDQLSEEGFEPTDGSTSPETLAEVSMIKNGINSLEKDYREVIYLKFVEGLSVKEIASILGVSENLVSVRINRGKKKLDDLFKRT